MHSQCKAHTLYIQAAKKPQTSLHRQIWEALKMEWESSEKWEMGEGVNSSAQIGIIYGIGLWSEGRLTHYIQKIEVTFT